MADDADTYPYDQPGDKSDVNNTNVLERFTPDGAGDNRSYKVEATRAQADATFTSETLEVDGIRDAAWDQAEEYPVANSFAANMTGDAPDATAGGSMRLLWDGPMLYVLVEVTGDATQSDSAAPTWNSASYTPQSDGLFLFMDVFNDQWGLETDTQGVLFLGANPEVESVATFTNTGIPSLGSFFDPRNQDYSTRLSDFASSGYVEGDGVNYTYEIALQMEGWGDEGDRVLDNGTQVGLELGVFDQDHSFSYWSKTEAFAGREGSSNLPNGERVRNRDWGVVTLAGKGASDTAAYSGWRADETIRYWDSASNPGGSGNGTGPDDDGDDSAVWTPASASRMVAAKAAYETIRDDESATRAQKEAAVQEVVDAYQALRWGDTTFPDPADLPQEQTLPNVLEFFDSSKGTDGMVTTLAEWEQRRQEILDLAQFYEYGYKPQLGEDYTIELLSNSYDGTGNASVTARVIPTNTNYTGGEPVDVDINVTLPASVPGDQKAAIGFGTNFTGDGIASVGFPTWAFDVRSNPYVWGTDRSVLAFGPFQFPITFYTLFPYERNSTSGDTSILMANATAVSVYLDALQMAVEENAALDAKIDPQRAVTKGFSIGGKNAFVAAVYDDRVKAVIAGGAGATGPANWRYNAQGQEYDFSGTDYYNPGAEDIVAHGTEGPGNSYRHNRVRETELFRHFMDDGHMYSHEDGSYGYGNYSRLPFDQSSLVATLAPDRAIIIDTNLNDYNDGSTTDNMSLQIAKSVYDNLGVDGSDFVKFNSGDYVSSGDPHGAAGSAVEGKYLSDFLYGTSTLSDSEAAHLATDPYALEVSNGQTQSPYDYYWGGYNGITGGDQGIGGFDGWYFAGFDAELAGLRDSVDGSALNKGQTNALNKKLDSVVRLVSKGKATEAAAVLTEDFVGQVEGFASSGKISAHQADAMVAAALQLALAITTTEGLRPAWTGAVQFGKDDEVIFEGSLYRAAWTTSGQEPGDPNGAWQEIAVGEDGTAVWTASRIFRAGDVVTFDGATWEAQWYSRNQEPGDPNGPWEQVAEPGADGAPGAWTSTTVYNTGDQVTYDGHVYEAKWWTRNNAPGAQYGPWELVE
ncbi:carbohydrate-binding protein [uncultured Demequina sp.]|uniref:glucuronyl esterase domain-containing protein n=1 Tax=uncultured Demequina sp. TaxID=693499 RepID=UPI0025CF429F|nr:carbohydrate-binding protein [uncultured Demequina sp.]